MTGVAVLVPFGASDEWRTRALGYVTRWYAKHFPAVPVVVGGCAAAEWSKGEAVANALAGAAGAQVLVLADADSFLADPDDLRRAVDLVRAGAPWVVPHARVYRLRDVETERLEANPDARPRLGWTVRPVYAGLAGGGITVVSREAFDTVGGIDRRFRGWGGEDLSFGYALDTLVGPAERLEGRLVHLWHPHPAPKLRGSEASEHLVGAYTAAWGFPRMMRDVIATGEHPQTLPPLEHPVRFRLNTKDRRRILRLGATHVLFENGLHVTDDVDHVEALRRHRQVQEIR